MTTPQTVELIPAEILDVADAIRTVTQAGYTGPISTLHHRALSHLLRLDLNPYEHTLVYRLTVVGSPSLPLCDDDAMAMYDLLGKLPDTSEADEDAWLEAREEAVDRETAEKARAKAAPVTLPTAEVVDLLAAIREALTVPYNASHPASREREWLFTDRARGVFAVIDNIIGGGGTGPATGASWWAARLRELTARHPVTYPAHKVSVRGGPDLDALTEAEYDAEKADA